jgi:MFS family permease
VPAEAGAGAAAGPGAETATGTQPPTATGAWLTRGVAGIGAASFLDDVGHEVPTALLPAFLTGTLGAPASALGLIEGVADGLSGLARLGGGALADDPDRRRAVAVGGYASTAVLSGAVGAAASPFQAGLLRAGAWTARGLRSPARNALLADVSRPATYGRAYGFERAMDNLGAIVGPLLAIVLVATVGTRVAIGLSAIPGLLAAGAIVYAVRQAPPAPARTAGGPTRTRIRIRVRPVLSGGLGRAMAGIAAFEMGNVAATLLILRATGLLDAGRDAEGATRVALGLYVAYNVAATVWSLPAGRIADRRGPLPVLAAGAALLAVAYAGFAAGPASVAGLLPWFLLAGLGIACAETAEHAAVAALAPADVRGSAFGMLAAVQSAGNLAASGVAGILWTAASPAVAFAYAGGWTALALAVLAGAAAARRADR